MRIVVIVITGEYTASGHNPEFKDGDPDFENRFTNLLNFTIHKNNTI